MVSLCEKLSVEEIEKRLDELQKDKRVQEYIRLMELLKVEREVESRLADHKADFETWWYR